MKVFSLVLSLLFMAACHRGPTTPLAKAAASGDVALVKELAATATKRDLQDALIAASRWSGGKSTIPALVAAGADPNGRWGVNDWSPLQHAIHKNQIESVSALAANGANINSRDRHGRTALMMAAGYGQMPIVAALLERGADPNIQDEDRLTALDFAITGTADIDDFTLGQCKPDIVKALLDRAPQLARSEKSWHSVANAVSRCGEVKTLLQQRRAELQNKPAGRS